MKTYKFIRVELEGVFPPKKPVQDYRKLIQDAAAQGWQLSQIFAPVVAPGPFAAYYEIILERDLNHGQERDSKRDSEGDSEWDQAAGSEEGLPPVNE
ncbi:MAG: DUF4177 domain-containing protein [Oscillospiraceae bacterium]|nr:DUF4177 domain-containing protein [Oscillospiraceae bacterium]